MAGRHLHRDAHLAAPSLRQLAQDWLECRRLARLARHLEHPQTGQPSVASLQLQLARLKCGHFAITELTQALRRIDAGS